MIQQQAAANNRVTIAVLGVTGVVWFKLCIGPLFTKEADVIFSRITVAFSRHERTGHYRPKMFLSARLQRAVLAVLRRVKTRPFRIAFIANQHTIKSSTAQQLREEIEPRIARMDTDSSFCIPFVLICVHPWLVKTAHLRAQPLTVHRSDNRDHRSVGFDRTDDSAVRCFPIVAVAKQHLQPEIHSPSRRHPIISSVHPIEPDNCIGAMSCQQIVDRPRHAQRFDRATSSMPERLSPGRASSLATQASLRRPC